LGKRTHVPFDVFAMQVDVPVSTMVRDDDFGWTCGQCPLDRDGDVVAPGDLVAQVKFVCQMIETVLQRAGFDIQSVGKLNVYFCEDNPGVRELAHQLLTRQFAHNPVLVLIPVPHFYYAGMLVEIDVFAGSCTTPRMPIRSPRIDLQIVDCHEIVWAKASVPRVKGATPKESFADISTALEQEGLTPDLLLSDHWFVSDDVASELNNAVSDCNLITNPDALVQLGPQAIGEIMGEFTFCRNAVEAKSETASKGKLSVFHRQGGNTSWISGTYAGPDTGLVDQTHHIMSGIENSLASENMSFGNVAKLTAHYVGDASAEELHGNMKIRHSFYARPGPASTGLPILAFKNPGCKISIDVFAIA
jgi:enamine deaminase RidA (YjgF/YER057c/UK114 family)